MSDRDHTDDTSDESNRNPADDDNPHRGGEERGPDRGGGGDGWLSNLVSALERLDRLSDSSDRSGPRTSLDYDVSIGSLDDPPERRGRDRHEREQRFDASTGNERRSLGNRSGGRRQRSSSNRYNVTTQAHEDEVVITADVSGIDREAVTVGYDGGSVVVGVSGSEIERVRPPWDETTADATVRNGVLTVTITEDSDE